MASELRDAAIKLLSGVAKKHLITDRSALKCPDMRALAVAVDDDEAWKYKPGKYAWMRDELYEQEYWDPSYLYFEARTEHDRSGKNSWVEFVLVPKWEVEDGLISWNYEFHDIDLSEIRELGEYEYNDERFLLGYEDIGALDGHHGPVIDEVRKALLKMGYEEREGLFAELDEPLKKRS